MRALRLPSGEQTWTVVDGAGLPIEPIERWLDHLRLVRRYSPNTVKAYGYGVAAWWQFLASMGVTDWHQPRRELVGRFINWLETGSAPPTRRPTGRRALGEGTVYNRVKAVTAFYAFWDGESSFSAAAAPFRPRRSLYRPMLAHIQPVAPRLAVGLRPGRRTIPSVLRPEQMEAIFNATAEWDVELRRWRGNLRNRFLWELLAGTGARLGETLGLKHKDWMTSRGNTASVVIEPRQDHPHGYRVKNGAGRRIFLSSRLDNLYGDLVEDLCRRGGADGTDMDEAFMFVNLERPPLFAPMRVDTVYSDVQRLNRVLAGRLPAGWTPHWFRHTHATALLLSNIPAHVVARRLGHSDAQTSLAVYAHVTDDAELRALGGWEKFLGPEAA